MIAYPKPMDVSELAESARQYFTSVELFPYQDTFRNAPWPQAANWAFQETARRISALHVREPWLWWEPDAVPLKPGWLDTLQQAYTESGKLFAGPVATQQGMTYMAGVAIYPPNPQIHLYHAFLCRSEPFDIIASVRDGVLRKGADISHLIYHVLNHRTFRSVYELDSFPETAVLFHKCKDATLAGMLENRGDLPEIQKAPNTFYHSGDLGDVIYGLPVVKALGGGNVLLGPDNRSGMRTREPMSPARTNLIVPLLRDQHYIAHAGYSAKVTSDVTHDLNDFRHDMVKGQSLDLKPGFNLARVPLHHFGLPLELDMDPWLTVSHPNRVASVIVARSQRYNDPRFDWSRIVSEYRGDIAFVGTKAEHDTFCAAFGKVPHHRTENLLEVAQAIAAADLFIGNQSSPYAIAIGLGKTSILEMCPNVSNCIFGRGNVINGLQPDTKLPFVKRVRPVTITAPIENYTGYGQLGHELIVQMVQRGLGVNVNAFAIDDSRTPIAQEIKDRLIPKNDTPSRTPGLLICSILEVPTRLVKGDVLLTMWEATMLSSDMVRAINERALCVIVPTQWNASCFSACGVTVPIRVVPLGVDPAVYCYRKPSRNKVFRFGTAGRLAHAGARKGVEETIRCFLDTFPIEQDVELHIKIFEDCKLPAHSDKRIVYYRRFLPQQDMVNWYAALNCFISLTKGEGWGLHIHQAMAIGRPVIVPRGSGQSEFVTEENALCCRFSWEFADWTVYKGFGKWCVCDMAHASELMRYAYEHRTECERLGHYASKSVAHYTWTAMVDGIVGALQEFGKI